MSTESAKSVELPDLEARFRAAVEALHQHADGTDAEHEFPFIDGTFFRLELTGESSVLFDLPGTATETPRRTQYSAGADGRLYGAVEGEPLAPIKDFEAQSVLAVLEQKATALAN